MARYICTRLHCLVLAESLAKSTGMHILLHHPQAQKLLASTLAGTHKKARLELADLKQSQRKPAPMHAALEVLKCCHTRTPSDIGRVKAFCNCHIILTFTNPKAHQGGFEDCEPLRPRRLLHQ